MAEVDSLTAQFEKFCNFGTGGTSKKAINVKNLTKVFKDCKLYGKALTSTDTDIAFSGVKAKGKNEIGLGEFKELLKTVSGKYAKDKKLANNEAAYDAMVAAIQSHGPGTTGTTKVSATGGVGRMTDASQYTGSHKERFNADGTGKGIEGRQDVVANDGYVGNYQGKDTYDGKHQ